MIGNLKKDFRESPLEFLRTKKVGVLFPVLIYVFFSIKFP